MIWTIVFILLVMWLIGITVTSIGSILHLLLVVAVVLFIVNLITGKKVT